LRCQRAEDRTGAVAAPHPVRFAPRPAAELDLVLSKTFGVPARRAAQLMPALDAIADAPRSRQSRPGDDHDVHLGLPVLDDAQTMRARRAETMLRPVSIRMNLATRAGDGRAKAAKAAMAASDRRRQASKSRKMARGP